MEALYQYAWRHRLLEGMTDRLCDGREVKILSPGVLNTNAGPDFSQARIELDGIRWVGNVEIHERASDWYRHGHDSDSAYANVLLHVVAEDDARVYRADGTEIPQLVLKLPAGFTDSYGWVEEGLDTVYCHRLIKILDNFDKTYWIERMGMERMQAKASAVHSILQQTAGDWQRAMFITLARGLGFGLNADPMERLAAALPLNFAARHADNPVQIEAMLFGLAGMLDPGLLPKEEYYQYLCREFRFLSIKYGLRPVRDLGWKFARTRPGNFPYRRISILAMALAGGFSMVDTILNAADSLDYLREVLTLPAGKYWEQRYSFGGTQTLTPIKMSVSSVNLLIINVAVPFLYAYGALHNERRFEELAIDILCTLPAEQNTYVRSWGAAGLKASNAFESQALLYLKKVYCDNDKCLDCRFAQLYIKKWIQTLRKVPE